jgi:hypothetical protein
MKGSRTSAGLALGSPNLRMALAILCGLAALSSVTRAQTPNRQCGDYVEAYKGGPVAYGTYLQVTADVAKSRDAQEGSSRYSRALQASSAPSNALWLNNWCTKNPLRGFTEASSRLLDELTGQTQAAVTPGQGGPSQIVVMAPPPPPEPSACRVGDVGQCRGCSVTCGNGSQAKCKPGSTFAGPEGNCAFQATCECSFGKNAPQQQPTSGMSTCRIGNVGACSGCSVTCNNGQTPVCKPGSEFAGGGCAFQSKCSCK